MKKFSIRVKLLLIALVPSILLSVLLAILAATNIQSGMQEEALHGLRGCAMSLLEIYDCVDDGDYTSSAGVVKKGSISLTDNYKIVDEMKELTEYEVTMFYGDTRVTTSLKDVKTGERLVGTQASEAVIEAVLNKGEEYSDTNVSINGESYYAYYVPIEQDGKVIGMAFAGRSSAEADSYITSKVLVIVAVSAIELLIILAIGIKFAVSLGRAITDAQKAIKSVQEGDLRITVNEKAKKRNDEVGSMTRELELLVEKLKEIIGNVKNSSRILKESGVSLEEMATQTSNTTNEISRAVEDVSRGAMSQAEETETASHNISQMGEVITGIVASVDSLGNTSLDMKNASDESAVIIRELSESNDRTTQAIAKISEQVNTTNESVQAIRAAVELITSIATETNLLSLNASIEAARAGEQGRGFAVVAAEIQKLAEESNNSTQKIDTIINTLLIDSEQTVEVMKEVNEIVQVQRMKLEETKAKFASVTDGVNSTRSEAEDIAQQADVCDAARAKIMEVIESLSAISEENAASSQETNASMEELNANLSMLAETSKDLLDLSTELEESMEFFKI